MERSRSAADGFTLLEVMVALAILSAVVVVGLESVGVGAAVRARAAEYAAPRSLAEQKLAELAALSGSELLARQGIRDGSFDPPFAEARWTVEVKEAEPGTGLFLVQVDVQLRGARLRASTYLNRFGELWARRRATQQ